MKKKKARNKLEIIKRFTGDKIHGLFKLAERTIECWLIKSSQYVGQHIDIEMTRTHIVITIANVAVIVLVNPAHYHRVRFEQGSSLIYALDALRAYLS